MEDHNRSQSAQSPEPPPPRHRDTEKTFESVRTKGVFPSLNSSVTLCLCGGCCSGREIAADLGQHPPRARHITAARPRLPYSAALNRRTWKAWLVHRGVLLAPSA